MEITMKILKGADVVSAMNAAMKEELLTHSGPVPKLAVVRIGEKPDDLSYERGAKKRMETIGIQMESFVFPETITNERFQKEFDRINQDPSLDGILLLRPLPPHLDEKAIENRIQPEKDVDSISPFNLSKVFAGDDTGFAPCTAEAVLCMLDYADIPLEGKRVTIIGRSMVVGRPLSMLFLKRNATVTICHTKTVNLKEACQSAEILAVCAGKPNMLPGSYVGKGAVILDVGIHVDENGRLCGDVDFNSLPDTVSYVTPVPGGVGTVTTSVLAKHVILAAKRKQQSSSAL